MKRIIFILITIALFSGCWHDTYIIQEEDEDIAAIYGYLNNTATVSITDTSIWYTLPGFFINDPIEGFIFNDSDHSITYTHFEPHYMLITGFASHSSSKSSTTTHVSFSVNGVVNEQIGNVAFLKNIGESYIAGGNGVTEINTGDVIKIVVKSDKVADITFDSVTLSINKFFQ